MADEEHQREPGHVMAAEMAEQPRVLGRLAERREEIIAAVRGVLPRPLRGIVLVARGSSDHAAVYGRYVLEAASGLPVALAAPSLHTLYGVSGRYGGYVAVATSQSGRTPEVVTVLERMRQTGAVGVALTNDASSPLAHVADAVVTLEAGEERAIPATKTFTAQLAAFAFLAESVGHPPWDRRVWETLPGAVEQVLGDAGRAAPAAEFIGDGGGLIVAGRGYLYASALEVALKLKEAARVLAQGYSSADLRHGPIAVVERHFPAVLIAAHGPAWDDMEDLAGELSDRGADVLRIAPGGDLPFGEEVAEPMAAFPAAIRGQQLAHALALHRGLDPDRPEGLHKVTATR